VFTQAQAPVAIIVSHIVSGTLEVKVKQTLGPDKWKQATCEYNPHTHEFTCCVPGARMMCWANCWVMDISDRAGGIGRSLKRNRVDVISDGKPLSLAALGEAEKQKWITAATRAGRCVTRGVAA
jgi:hypothetical protein